MCGLAAVPMLRNLRLLRIGTTSRRVKTLFQSANLLGPFHLYGM